MFLSDEGPTLETCDFTFQIGRTPTFLHVWNISVKLWIKYEQLIYKRLHVVNWVKLDDLILIHEYELSLINKWK